MIRKVKVLPVRPDRPIAKPAEAVAGNPSFRPEDVRFGV